MNRQPPEAALIMAIYNATGYGKLTTDDGILTIGVLHALGYELRPRFTRPLPDQGYRPLPVGIDYDSSEQ